jgi:hypothetical protein
VVDAFLRAFPEAPQLPIPTPEYRPLALRLPVEELRARG